MRNFFLEFLPPKENEALYKKATEYMCTFEYKKNKEIFNGITKYGLATNIKV